MAKMDPVGFPMPDGYVPLYNAFVSVIGHLPAYQEIPDEDRRAYFENASALWGDVWAALLFGSLISYGTVPKAGFGPLPAPIWSHRQTKGPPIRIDLEHGAVAPLVRIDDVKQIAALWDANPRNIRADRAASPANNSTEASGLQPQQVALEAQPVAFDQAKSFDVLRPDPDAFMASLFAAWEDGGRQEADRPRKTATVDRMRSFLALKRTAADETFDQHARKADPSYNWSQPGRPKRNAAKK